MFVYYTAVLIVTISVILSALVVIYYDEILEKFNRNIFLTTFIVLLFSAFFDWFIIYLEMTTTNRQKISTLFMSLLLFVGPSIIIFLAWGINDRRSKLLYSIVLIIVTLNFLISFSGLFTNKVFYFDEQNNYQNGKYFFLVYIMILISTLVLFVNTFRLGRKYQNRSNYILTLDIIVLLVSLVAHFRLTNVWILWIGSAITASLLYIYYASVVNQIDVLTGILNRKCFDNQIYDLITDSIIIIFDVNKFKEINDTLGHTVGDYCLKEIASTIKSVYGKSGYCYRLGGDEFAVILHKNLESIEVLNSKFIKLLSEKKGQYELPTVSIGHSIYYPNKSSVQKVIEEADMMMYLVKPNKSTPNIITE